MGKIIALANQKGGVGKKQRLRLTSQLHLLHWEKKGSRGRCRPAS